MRVNINKLFSFLSLKKKLVIAFVALSIAPLLIIGSYSVYSNVKTMREIALENIKHDVAIIREKTAEFLYDVEGDVRFLSELCSEGNLNGLNKKEFCKQLITFAKNRCIYYQIKLIASSGDEIFRIESDFLCNYFIIPDSELRQNRESYYFVLTEKLKYGQIAFAPAEIIKRNGKIVLTSEETSQDLIPVITCAMRVFNKHNKRFEGIIIANIFAEDFFKVVEEKHHINLSGKTVLVNGSGFYLYHHEKKKNWNKLVASQGSENLHSDYSPQVVSQILSGKEGTVLIGMNEIIAYAPLFDLSKISHLSGSYFIYENVPQKIIFGHIISFATAFLGVIFIFLIVSILFAFLATNQIAKPIDELKKGVEIISKGNYTHHLNIETNDEIEILAKQFNVMADFLKQREIEINEYKNKLEQMVYARTKELNDKKNEIQTILDNVPSAFVMLDKDFHIRSASFALKSITGFTPEEVRGKHCYEIFGQKEICEICPSRKAIISGKVENYIETRKNLNGGNKYLEHISIPIKRNDEVISVLEVITDVTEQKKMEEHLILSEKLAVTGEMSAIIAHEVRNSLTSIKMILQLQSESKRLSKTDKSSIEVALNSMYHMERVINQLLHFARPSPMQFKKSEINKILENSLSFVEPQFEKKKIKIIKNLSKDLPKTTLDENYLEEAFINLIINAYQSIPPEIDQPLIESKEGEIKIETEKSKLDRTLKDFVYDSHIQNDDKNSEITLTKGMEVIIISIQDSGSGIKKENLSRIFDPFFSTKIGGTGLGLAMVKRTINAHNGIINVESEVEKGTKFVIYLPIK
jgi:PAS domain S-box-containing protein